ncbi:cyclin-I2 [Lissotriton helveticus]
MKFTGTSESQRLSFLLENALAAEDRVWKVPAFQNFMLKGTDISTLCYEETILWIGELCLLFQFSPETFGLAVNILNRVLASVKAQSKYLRCIAVTCVVLAAKTSEEDEVIPSLKKLAVESGCKCSPAEILRMERILLDKLHWDLYTATPVDFLNIFHAMVMYRPHVLTGPAQMNPSRHVAFLTRQLQHCMARHQVLQFKGSTLALVIITLELERLTPDWFPVITDLLKKAQVDSTLFIHCKELVDQLLRPPSTNAVYIFDPASKYIRARCKGGLPCTYSQVNYHRPITGSREVSSDPVTATLYSATERMHDDGMEIDEFYDGFHHLYKEDAIFESGRIDDSGTCCRLREEIGNSPCPPLQAP